MKVKITISLENAAFHDPIHELTRILGRLTEDVKLSDTIGYIPLMDANGNKVGQMEVE